ncbi:MAG: SOUL family heme-binding protein [Myxococcota bacterium]
MKNAGARSAALGLALLGMSAMATEQPKYEVVQRYDDFEVRAYGPVVVAETEVDGEQSEAGNQAFSLLAGYIFGNNQGAKKIAMTAPVAQTPSEGTRIAMTAPVTQTSAGSQRWTVQFTMPAAWTLDTLPVPKDARVKLRTQLARRVAVVRYSGTWSQRNYDEHLEQLRAALRREGLEAKGEPTWARYDPPWTPWFLRTNEIHLEVTGG